MVSYCAWYQLLIKRILFEHYHFSSRISWEQILEKNKLSIIIEVGDWKIGRNSFTDKYFLLISLYFVYVYFLSFIFSAFIVKSLFVKVGKTAEPYCLKVEETSFLDYTGNAGTTILVNVKCAICLQKISKPPMKWKL